MENVVSVPRHMANTFEIADIMAFIISTLLMGKEYYKMNDSFFITTLILLLSPMLRKIDFYLSGESDSINKKIYKITNLLELSLVGLIVIICILGIINIVHICNDKINHTVYIRVVEDYVFFSGVGFDSKFLMGGIFCAMILKIFNAVSSGVVIKK